MLTMTPHMMTRPDWLAGLVAMLAILLIQLSARLL
jgi:hypothetical protein